jgi:uncharacterized protein
VSDASAGISAYNPQLTQKKLVWLRQLDDEPTTLLQHLSVSHTHRLGVYFEQLWHFFLQQDPDTELIAHNLAVRESGRTLGEFDCIVYNKPLQCHVHLELAVKFFLGAQPPIQDTVITGNAQNWLGPDRKDRLATKLDQLLQRQILLGEAPAAKQALDELGIVDVARQIVLKGHLFQPVSDPLPLPPGYNTACPLSLWMTRGELDQHCAALDASAFAILPKARWLSAAQYGTQQDQLNRDQLTDAVTQQLDADQYPLLIAALDSSGAESSRFFVTAQDWADHD